MSSGSKEEPRYACLIDAKASHRQRMWVEFSSSAPLFRHVCQPHQMEVPTQSVMSGKKYGNHPGLSPSKGPKPNPGAPTRTGDLLPSLSLGVLEIPPSSLVLIPQPAINPRPNILPRYPQSRPWNHKTGGRTVLRKPVGSLITCHP
jgi:hypothetical protein